MDKNIKVALEGIVQGYFEGENLMELIQGIPYSHFKEKMAITKQYEKTSYIKDLGNVMYIKSDDKRGNRGMEIRCKGCRKLLGKIERAEDCAIEIKCTKCGLKESYELRNI